MKARGLEGASRRKGCRMTSRDDASRPAPDLVERAFAAEAPDRLWVADITYVPTWEGFLYLAVMLDVFSRHIVGWVMAAHLRTEPVLSALNMALWQRQPEAVVHHSDQGGQYTSLAFSQRCEEAGLRDLRWAVSETASIMPWRRGSMPPWNVSCWTQAHSARVPGRSVPSSSSSRVGTIRIVGTRRRAICRQSTSNGSMPGTRARLIPQMLNCPLKRDNSIRLPGLKKARTAFFNILL